MSKAIVGAYWGARQETREDCADRLLRFFRLLERAHSASGKWFQRMHKKTDPVVPMPDNVAGMTDQLRATLDDSSPRKAIEELGSHPEHGTASTQLRPPLLL